MPPVTIHDDNAAEFVQHIQESGFSRGLEKRNYASHPSGCYASVPTYPDSLLITDEKELEDRLAAQIANQASLFDLREANYDVLKSLDQNGYGLCWAFSSTKANMYARARMGEIPLRLSAYFVAGKVKGWRDQGGWGTESAQFLSQQGAPLDSMCPEYRHSYDTAETEANAALHRVTVWFDGTEDRERNWLIAASAFVLGGIPVLDYDWLSHSMCGCRLVDVKNRILDTDNSWGETSQYGEKGCYRLQGSRAVPDNVCVVFGSLPSVS